MPRRYFSNAAVPTSLAAAITAVQTNISVGDKTGYPTVFPFTITLEKNVAGKGEACEVTGPGTVPATDWTVVRGVDNTTAQTHGPGSLVSHDHTARDYVEIQEALDKLSGQTPIEPKTTGGRGLIVRGLAGQTANLAEFQNSAGTVLSGVSSGGALHTGPGAIGFANGVQLSSVSSSASVLGLVIRGAASQTANLAEFQDSSGTVLASIAANGDIYSNGVKLESGMKVLGGSVQSDPVATSGASATGNDYWGHTGGDFTFVAPASGRVVVICQTGSQPYNGVGPSWKLSGETGTGPLARRRAAYGGNNNAPTSNINVLTGLTPGSTYTINTLWAAYAASYGSGMTLSGFHASWAVEG